MKATAEHAPLTELERASAAYTQAVSACTKAEAALSTSEAAEDAAEAKLEAVLRRPCFWLDPVKKRALGSPGPQA